MKKILYCCVTSILMLLSFCTRDVEDVYLTNDFGSSLRVDSGVKYSTFSLSRECLELEDIIGSLTIKLKSCTDQSVYSFNATLICGESDIKYCIEIPVEQTIPDDDYLIYFIFEDESFYPSSLILSVKDEMIWRSEEQENIYSGYLSCDKNSTEREGSQRNPYRIKDDSDLTTFFQCLHNDASYAKDIYFVQTDNIKIPVVSNVNNDNRYSGEIFAGHYNGGGHTIILLEYSGGLETNDVNVGFFKALYGGATVRNITFEGADMSGIYSNGGTLAGAIESGESEVVIENIKLTTTISGKSAIGGLVGYVKGNVTINDCHLLTVNVISDNYAGGLIGYIEENSTLNVNNYSNYDNANDSASESRKLDIKAKVVGAGGVAGYMKNSSCNISNVKLVNSISQEGLSIKCIYSGDEYNVSNGVGSEAGGLFGRMEISGDSSFSNISIQSPVESVESDAGGLVGVAVLNAKLTLFACTSASHTTSPMRTGGFFGCLTGSSTLCLGYEHSGGGDVLDYNRVVAVDSGFLRVDGGTNVGGMIGEVDGCDVILQDSCRVNVDVRGELSVGGLIGKLKSASVTCGKIITDPNMNVKGKQYVGGIVGEMNSAKLHGGNDVNAFDTLTIPTSTNFVSNYRGGVKHISDVATSGESFGGIVGYSIGSDSEITGCCFSGSISGATNIGGVVGCTDGLTTIHDCVTRETGSINGYKSDIGGVVGLIAGNIEELLAEGIVTGGYTSNIYDCINYADVNASGIDHVGGIIGKVIDVNKTKDTKLSRCINMGHIYGGNRVGGILGSMIEGNDDRTSYFTAEYLVNYGDITTSSAEIAGGVIGRADLARIFVRYCVNHGSINASGSAEDSGGIGGVVGVLGHNTEALEVQKQHNYDIAYCCNKGNLSSSSRESHIGGVVGRIYEGSGLDNNEGASCTWSLHNCYNAGAITSNQEENNGGLVGVAHANSEIKKSMNIGHISYGNGDVGEVSGVDHTIEDSYILYGSAGDIYKKSDSEFFYSSNKLSKSTFEAFDFNSVWAIDSDYLYNEGYPYLQGCPFQ